MTITTACTALATRALPGKLYPTGFFARVPRTLGAVLAIAVTAGDPAPAVLSGGLLAVLALTWLWQIMQYLATGGDAASREPGIDLKT